VILFIQSPHCRENCYIQSIIIATTIKQRSVYNITHCILLTINSYRFTPVILASWEAKIGKIVLSGQPRQGVLETPSQPIAKCGGAFQATGRLLWYPSTSKKTL
jgi:hypothetical protein